MSTAEAFRHHMQGFLESLQEAHDHRRAFSDSEEPRLHIACYINSVLADVLGIRKAGDILGTTGNAYSARIEKQHAILEGLTGTNWIAGADRVPIRRWRVQS
jgi:hypothetical protein